MKTVVIQIGNSDNKLTQNEWAHYAASMNLAVMEKVFRVHFKGGSDWDAPWQNACWVCEIQDGLIDSLLASIRQCRENYRQDSVAVMLGDTQLI